MTDEQTTSTGKPRVVAVEGLFRPDVEPLGRYTSARLLGSRCTACGSYFFPRENVVCRNPRCRATTLQECELGGSGVLWSFTSSEYQPPPPFVSPAPFRPFAIAAVELPNEKLVVLGQVISGVLPAQLKVGMPMQLVTDVLDEDEAGARLVWKWAPAEHPSLRLDENPTEAS